MRILNTTTTPRTVQVTTAQGEASATIWADGAISLFVGDRQTSGDVRLKDSDDALAVLAALSDAVRDICDDNGQRQRTLREHIEDTLGLEPSFQVLNDGGALPWSVYDAEMQVVCRCEERERADLIRDLLGMATR